MSANKSVKFQIKLPSNCWENNKKTLGGYFILPHPVGDMFTFIKILWRRRLHAKLG